MRNNTSYQHRSPSPAQLWAVNQAESGGGENNCENYSQTSRQYWIKKSSKKQFFDQRSECYAENGERPRFGRSVEELINRHVGRNRQEVCEALQRHRQMRTPGSKNGPAAAPGAACT